MPEQAKIDMLYRIASNIYIIAIQLAAGWCLNVLCRNFVAAKKKMLLVGGTYFFAVIFLNYIPIELENFVAYSVSIAAAFGVCMLLDKGKMRLKIFLFATFFVLRWIGFSTVSRVMNMISLWAQRMIVMYTGSNANTPELWKIYYIEFAVNCLADAVLCLLLLYVMVKIICRFFIYKYEDIETKEMLFMTLPAINGMVIYGLFRVYTNLSRDKTDILGYGENLAADALWILCYAVILAVILVTVILYQDIRKKCEDEGARLMLESKVRDIRTHITEVEKLYADIRSVKHDIKNHVEVMDSLLAQGKINEAKEYAKSFSETVEVYDFAAKTGNPVTDVIISEKMREALKENIDFVSDFHYPIGTKIDAFDISVILSNALSNALEAVKAGGYIRVSSFVNKNIYLITVENSYDGYLDIDEVSGLPRTVKEDKKSHGFGLKNIKSVAAKYYGDLKIEQKEAGVVVTVMLLIT